MKLLFVINNIQEAYYEYENTGSMPAVKKRFVEIELTDEQVRKIGIRNIGYSSRTPITETIESVSLLLEGAVQADKHPESSWISVKERLPEDDFNCIVTNEYGRGRKYGKNLYCLSYGMENRRNKAS